MDGGTRPATPETAGVASGGVCKTNGRPPSDRVGLQNRGAFPVSDGPLPQQSAKLVFAYIGKLTGLPAREHSIPIQGDCQFAPEIVSLSSVGKRQRVGN